MQTAFRLSPHDWEAPDWQTHLCSLYAHLAQWEQAIEQCEKAVAASYVDNGPLSGIMRLGVRQVAEGPENTGPLLDLAAAYAWAGHDREAKETAARLHKRDPGWDPWWILWLQMYMDANDDPTFKAEVARIIEGLRKAGMPESLHQYVPKSN